MKKGRFIRFTIIAAFALVFILIIFSFISFEPPGLARLIENKAAQALHRDVKIGRVRLNLLGQISIQDIEINDRLQRAEYPFLKAEKAVASVDVIGLLFRRFSIAKFELRSPQISLHIGSNSSVLNIRVEDFKASGSASGINLNLSDIAFRIGEGRVSSSLELNFSKTDVSHSEKVKIENVALEELLSSSPRLQNNITGRIFLTLAGSGKGISENSLAGSANLNIKNGRMRALPLQNAVSMLLGIPELADIYFDNISGDFSIQDGRISTQNFKLTSRQVNIYASGHCDFSSRILFNVKIDLSPELASRVNLGRIGPYFTDESGRINIELKIMGTFSAPQVDWLSGQLERMIEKGLGEILKGVLKEKDAD